MGNLNRVMLIGRLTREPEVTEFKNGGKVANLGFAVHNTRKNAQTGEWEETPVWLNMKAYNHEHGRKLADLAARLHKGRQVFVEGHLVLEQWEGKEDNKHHRRDKARRHEAAHGLRCTVQGQQVPVRALAAAEMLT